MAGYPSRNNKTGTPMTTHRPKGKNKTKVQNCTTCMRYSKRFNRCKLKPELCTKTQEGKCSEYFAIPDDVVRKRKGQEKNREKTKKAKKCLTCHHVDQGWCKIHRQWASQINGVCNSFKEKGEKTKVIVFQSKYVYPAVFDPCEEGGYCLTFPDLPGIVTEGDTIEEAQAMAKEALKLHLRGMVRDNDEIPPPSSIEQIEPLEGGFVFKIEVSIL